MSELLQCPSCGGSNQLPEGKNSMFCAFCGSAIKAVEKENKLSYQNSIITKPEISKKKTEKKTISVYTYSKSYDEEIEFITDNGGELSLINRNIKSLDEITVWFSDNELNEIQTLNLNNNKINSLKGIERFQSLKTLSICNNEIHELPKENSYLKNLFRIYLFGNPIEQNISQNDLNYYSNIRFYIPTIKKINPIPDSVGDMVLSYEKQNISTVEEIVDLYSTDELYKIEEINFAHNNIKTLKGLSKFNSYKIDFSNNDLILIDELPKFRDNSYCSVGASIDLNFFNNKNLIEFTDNAIQQFYTAKIQNITIFLRGCENFNYDSLSRINFNRIFNSTDSEYSVIRIYNGYPSDANVIMPSSLKKIGFINDKNSWTLPKKGNPLYKKSGCFIATATMGCYEHPTVIELRYFRDNWILQKSWGEGFVKWYYHYGAIGAKYIEKSFILKKLSYLLIVKPLVYLSKILK